MTTEERMNFVIEVLYEGPIEGDDEALDRVGRIVNRWETDVRDALEDVLGQ